MTVTSVGGEGGGGGGGDGGDGSNSAPPLATSPLRAVLASGAGRRKLLACVCAWGVHTATFYTTFLFLPLYEMHYLGLPSEPSAATTTAGLLAACLLVPVAGRVADAALARRLSTTYGSLTASVLTPPVDTFVASSGSHHRSTACKAAAGATSPRVGLWAPPATCTLQRWLGVRVRALSLSLSLAAPLALLIAQLGVSSGSIAAAWTCTLFGALLMLAHHVLIDALVGAWLLAVFAPEVRYSAVAFAVNAGTMLFAAPAPAVEAALAAIEPATRWTAGLFVSLAALAAALAMRLGEDPTDERQRLVNINVA